MKKKWPKKILTWREIYERALLGMPRWKIRYGGRGYPRPYIAKGGPYNGRTLMLVDGTTAALRVKRDAYGAEWRGRYHCGLVASRFGSDGYGTTKWVPR